MPEAPDRRSPVLSLTVLDATSLEHGVLRRDSRVLVVARRPEANPTHPNVISVPTQRVPESLHRAITASATLTADSGGVSVFGDGEVDSDVDNGHHPVVYATESLLSRKLGLSEGLERGAVRFRAALRAHVDGTAVYDNFGSENVYEPIAMLNIVVALTLGQSRMPLQTSSYGPIGWTSVESFLDGVEHRDPRRISPFLDPIEFCVHGVCLTAAQASLKALLGRVVLPETLSATGDPLHGPPARG